jgi:hypothetical protein
LTIGHRGGRADGSLVNFPIIDGFIIVTRIVQKIGMLGNRFSVHLDKLDVVVKPWHYYNFEQIIPAQVAEALPFSHQNTVAKH